MKGEYTDETHRTTQTMFSKIHQTQKFQPHHLHNPTPQPQPYPTQPLHVTAFQNQPTSPSKTEPSQNDGASIEILRRPRGRPPGSKNKLKSPIIITREPDPSMSPYVLEIPSGSDLVSTITLYCKKRNSGLCVLNGSGTVANVTLKQPSSTPNATVTFHGRFDMLSLSGTIILPSLQHVTNAFTISLAGPQGQVVGGAVVGPLVAASTVYVIAASFNSPVFQRLPIEDENENNINIINNNSGGGADVASPSVVSGGGDIYSGQSMGADVIWAPTPRQAQPY
ncbi:AT-hook motif nuclear-localized protein 28-like [Apium graveolens]|uniref:AT-hook motif nuclear-localized protein 28-like n=1 Tax=Apium graveolens TaxID=4045 RepID=UPI003D78B7F3